jgi:hypothetical protein
MGWKNEGDQRMNDILTELEKAGQKHMGTPLGGTLQWAVIEIKRLHAECEMLKWRMASMQMNRRKSEIED